MFQERKICQYIIMKFQQLMFKKEVYEKYKRRIGIKPHITEVSGVECVDIDYPEDFEIANAIYMSMIKGGK